ncbi:hypothetical protein CDD83_523 [Cordyceps sp. RAO-2017]|nr:hypothetical protein CDD83_523 [Cordyceps sp. RAO-2017]
MNEATAHRGAGQSAEDELDEIWKRNGTPPNTVFACIDDIIATQVARHAGKTAVQAWDGTFTYRELDELATRLALRLIRCGVTNEVIVPLCFEKSRWTVVAMLGVLKARGAFALLDVAQPEARLRSIVQQCRANTVCSSRSKLQLASALATQVVTVGPSLQDEQRPDEADILPDLNSDPACPMYVCFTSGSTGQPKGIVLAHASFCTARQHQVDLLGFDSDSRVFDFASYGFDVAVHNAMTTLSVGGCLCIPSEDERSGRLNQALRETQATIVGLTPSVARLLQPDALPDLRTLILLGEPASRADVERLWDYFHVINAYGPAECTTHATINAEASSPEAALSIGEGKGALTWVVEPDDHTKLVPLGAVGELLLEGPLLARGYLDDPERTAASFISDTPWLLRGSAGNGGRRGRLYKTGDLVRYGTDGSLSFVGRKDTQAKLRGQRLELGEVEHQVRECMPSARQAIAEVVELGGEQKTRKTMLAVFLTYEDEQKHDGHQMPCRHEQAATDAVLVRVEADVEAALSRRLPAYMMPAVYLRVAAVPLTASGKTDRRRLRGMASALSPQRLAELHGAAAPEDDRRPRTGPERRLQGLWAQVLGVDASTCIGPDDHFFRLGGDSIGAMELVGAASRAGLSLAVADVFRYPVLAAQARVLAAATAAGEEAIPPFSLLRSRRAAGEICEHLAGLCGIEASQIQDAYPCTPLQEGLLSLSAKREGDYVGQMVLELCENMDLAALRAAWEQAVSSMAVLRTRIVPYDDDEAGFLQLVTDTPIHWLEATGLDRYLEADRKQAMSPGQPLARYALVNDDAGPARWLVWTVHHALCDGWSVNLVLQAVYRAYRRASVEPGPRFQTFIKYVRDRQNDDRTSIYWQQALSDYECAPFPALPPSIEPPVADEVVQHQFCWPRRRLLTTTTTTLVRAAWALVAGNLANSRDVVFGATVSGRSAPVSAIEAMAAPTIATVPVRTRLAGHQTVSEYLEAVQRQSTDMIPFEQAGLHRIAKLCPGARRACMFQTLLVVQPPETSSEADGAWRHLGGLGRQGPGTYALILEVRLGPDTITASAAFDARVTEPWLVRTSLERLEHVMHQLGAADSRLASLAEIETATARDLERIWAWNSRVPAAMDRRIHEMVEDRAEAQPSAPAVCAWDGELAYGELDRLAAGLAGRLLRHTSGLDADAVVPLCFEKSMWSTVAMLAVLKAGRGFVLLDAAIPYQRLAAMVQQVRAGLILSSPANQRLCARLCPAVMTVSQALYSDTSMSASSCDDDITEATSPLPPCHPSRDSIAYVVFTSGTTGMPKGVAITHRNASSAVHHQADALAFGTESRVFDFSSPSFDATIFNALTTLASGGCLCIPSDQGRKDRLAASIAALRANTALFTPSVARLLSPELVPELQTVLFGGEALHLRDVASWWARARVMNLYGPSECTAVSTINSRPTDAQQATHIGRGAGLVTWVVSPESHDVLLPPGCVGELVLEGPLVGQGYLNDPQSTATAFVEDPAWLLRGAPGRPGRRGRLYKTGDLVRYNEDGSLVFVGRKNTQVKIRGQRVELAEVEHWVQKCIPESSQVAVEVVEPQGPGSSPLLAAFLCLDDETVGMKSDGPDGLSAEMLPMPADVEDELANHLPSYMVPTVIFSMRQLPMTATEKTNRRRLREIGSSFSVEQMADTRTAGRGPKQQPSGEVERRMQEIWARVLGIDTDSIGLSDSFFRLGGDSVAAMRVVAAAGEAGISLTVADMFRHPTLAMQAQARRCPTESGSVETTAPFSLLGRGRVAIQQLCEDLAVLCSVEPSRIEDAYPCTPLQEGLLSLTAKGAAADSSRIYTMQATLELSEHVDVGALRRAWEAVVRSTAILRTRIVQHGSLGLVQVVCREDVEWASAPDLEAYLEEDRLVPMELGSRLSRLALVDSGTDEPRRLVWTVHHALYDGWSLPLTLGAVGRVYRGRQEGEQAPPFRAFVEHVASLDSAEAEAYWRSYLAGGDFATFPAVPTSVTEPAADALLEADFSFAAGGGLTASTLIRGALAVVLSEFTGSADVVFGAVVSGRNAPVAGIDKMTGPTIATVPVRLRVPKEQSAWDALQTVQQDAAEMIPYEQTGLQRIAGMGESGRGACGFQTLLVVQPRGAGELPADTLGAWSEPSGRPASRTYAVTLECLLGSPGAVTARASFDPRAVDRWTMDRMMRRFGVVLRRLSQARPGQPVRAIEALAADEEEAVGEWNRPMPPTIERCVHHLISERARARPESPAVHAWDGELTYGELDDLSARLTGHLVELRVGPGSFVPLCFYQSAWTVVAMLAVLKAGAAFVLLDPALPDDRLRSTCEQLHATLCVASQACEARVAPLVRRVLVLREPVSGSREADGLPQMPETSPSSAAYIVYTSGRTAEPTGYVFEHRTCCSAALSHGAAMGLDTSTRALQLSSYACAGAVPEVLMTLLHGGCVCIPSEEDRSRSLALAIGRLGANWASVTPTVLAGLAPDEVPSLRTICLAGEPVRRSQISEWAPKVQLLQAYGCTAVSGIVSSVRLDASSAVTNVGRAAAARCWIVDPADPEQLVPVGAPGEIVLEGPVIGKAHAHEPGETSVPGWRAAFASCGPPSRFYRTGDLGSYCSDGSVSLLGSKHRPLTLHGRRLDLAEIEHQARLSRPDIKEAVVEIVQVTPCQVENGQEKAPELVGFLLSHCHDGLQHERDGSDGGQDEQTSSLAIQDVRDRLEAVLPHDLVPSILVPISKLPLTISRKTDRKGLCETLSALSARQLAELRPASGWGKRTETWIERCLRGLWAQLLGIDRGGIGPRDSFFHLGGDSIGAMRLVAAAREAGVELAIADIFHHPRLHHMAKQAAPLAGRLVRRIPSHRTPGPVAQSSAQQRLWFLDQLQPGLNWFLVPCAVRLRGPLRLDALRAALQALEQRHESLRTTFSSPDGVNVQTVHPFRPGDLDVVDIVPPGDAEALARALRRHQTTPFDLRTEPGWRVSVYRLGRDDSVLSIVMHHIVCDGWSVDILRRELAAFYSAAVHGRDPLAQAGPLPVQYRDASVWQEQQDRVEARRLQLDYWLAQLETSRPAELFCDRPRAAALSGRADAQGFSIGGALYRELRQFCRARGVTAFVVLLAAFRASHYRLTGAADATVGVPNANRERWELEGVIGFFVNLQCIRIKIEDDESFDRLVRQVQATTIAALANKDVPFEAIVSRLQRDRDLSRHPLVQMVLALHPQPNLARFELEGVQSEPIAPPVTSRFDLELHFYQEQDSLRGNLVFSTDLYEAETIKNLLSVFRKVLERGLAGPGTAIASLPLFTGHDYSLLDGMGLLRVDRTDYPRDSSVVDVFRQVAAANPDVVAVKDASTSVQLTYAQLDQRSEMLSGWLARRPLSPETLVGVLAGRSCDAVVAFLGILKTNLGYVPFDVKTPVGRMETILSSLQSRGPPVVLMDRDIQRPAIQCGDIDFVCIADALHEQAQHMNTDSYILAYVMFTSGSTGRPKGVMVEHRSILRLVKQSNLIKCLPRAPTTAHMASIAFDASTWEIYAALLNGGTLVCIDSMLVLDHIALPEALAREQVQAMFITPTLLKQYLLQCPTAIGTMNTLIVGGDRLDPQDIMAVQRLTTPGVRVINGYGPTENTGFSTYHSTSEQEIYTDGVPIGRALSNSGAYVMDPQQRLVPLGVVGELVVTGDGLARGYIDPQQSQDRFVSVTVCGNETKAYRTGDYVRYRPVDGQLMFLGRMDGQVKIRGQRAEVGEIEHQARLSCPDVQDVAVELTTLSDSGDRGPELVGFLVMETSHGEAGQQRSGGSWNSQTSAAVRRVQARLQCTLPHYMVPSVLLPIPSLPLTVSGKTDRGRLREMGSAVPAQQLAELRRTARGEKLLPSSEAERRMQKIWSRVLQREPATIGLDDSFFQLGGDSITAMKVVGEARKVGVNLAVADVFRCHTLAELAHQQPEGEETARIQQELEPANLVEPAIKTALFEEIDSGRSDIHSRDVVDILPLTDYQEKCLLDGITQGQLANYFYLAIGAHLDLSLLERGCISTLERFPILRACFLKLRGRYWQVVLQQLEQPLRVRDERGDLEQSLRGLCLEDMQQVSMAGPPVAFFLLRHETQGNMLVLRMSHAQYDGMCVPVIFQSLMDAYRGAVLSATPSFSQYLSHASRRRPHSIAYWTKLLQGSNLTTIRPRLHPPGNLQHDAKVEPIRLREDSDLPHLPRGITMATLVSAAWAVLLSRIAGQADVVYGHLIAGRNSAIQGVEEMVGCCINIVPVRVTISPSQTAAELLLHVQGQFLSTGEADSLGFKDIIEHSTDWPAGSSFDAILQHQNVDEHPKIQAPGRSSRVQFFENPHFVPTTIGVVSYSQGDRLRIELNASTGIMTSETARQLLGGLFSITEKLAGCVEKPLSWLDEISLGL